MKKVGILTLPLRHNYGGLLQAYALQTTLQKLGFEVEIINREYNVFVPFSVRIKDIIKQLIGKDIEKQTKRFVKEHFKQTVIIKNTQRLKKLLANRYDVIIVGSDQVWRPKYSPCISNYYLDFIEDEYVRKVAYAASFGVDEWEYTNDDTVLCSKLAKRFDAISVRENSGVRLCKDYLGVDAMQVLDPTLLLNKNEYEKLVDESNSLASKGKLFVYILDKSPIKHELQDKLVLTTNYTPFQCVSTASSPFYPKVTQWIRSFMDAEMVLTDSFHGTVFSIIFNKPFWVVGNEERGLSRFETLLNLFGLEDRIIKPGDVLNYKKPIDWSVVNNKLNVYRQKSSSFLSVSING